MKYAIYFYFNNAEVHSLTGVDTLPLVGDIVIVNNYIGANVGRNGYYVVHSRNWLFDPTYKEANGFQIIDIDLASANPCNTKGEEPKLTIHKVNNK